MGSDRIAFETTTTIDPMTIADATWAIVRPTDRLLLYPPSRTFTTGGHTSWRAWVGLLGCGMFHHLAQLVLPISHQPRQNRAEGGIAKIKVNPTQVLQEMCHPVHMSL